MDRRELLMGVGASVVGSAFRRRVDAQAADTTRFFPGFTSFDVKTSGATIHGVVGGSGPPLLLMHGAPQSHVSWRIVAPSLRRRTP